MDGWLVVGWWLVGGFEVAGFMVVWWSFTVRATNRLFVVVSSLLSLLSFNFLVAHCHTTPSVFVSSPITTPLFVYIYALTFWFMDYNILSGLLHICILPNIHTIAYQLFTCILQLILWTMSFFLVFCTSVYHHVNNVVNTSWFLAA